MIYFHLPDFQRNFKLNLILIDYMKQNREMFIDNMEIAYIFDSFPLIWNGGRLIPGEFSLEYAKETIRKINELGVKIAFTFTNCMLQEEHLKDKDCNTIMEIASGNSIIINSPLLENYIREKYPNYNFILSTTRELATVDKINDAMKKDYELVVLDYNMNHDWDALAQIEDKSRCEFLVNACCKEHCPVRGEHYRFISEQQIKNANPKERENLEKWNCIMGNYNYFTYQHFPNFMSIEEIREKYEPMGFEHFKLEGRGSTTVHLLEQYVQYMVKAECRDEVRYHLLCRLLSNF